MEFSSLTGAKTRIQTSDFDMAAALLRVLIRGVWGVLSQQAYLSPVQNYCGESNKANAHDDSGAAE
jgi:hypothetical protein